MKIRLNNWALCSTQSPALEPQNALGKRSPWPIASGRTCVALRSVAADLSPCWVMYNLSTSVEQF